MKKLLLILVCIAGATVESSPLCAGWRTKHKNHDLAIQADTLAQVRAAESPKKEEQDASAQEAQSLPRVVTEDEDILEEEGIEEPVQEREVLEKTKPLSNRPERQLAAAQSPVPTGEREYDPETKKKMVSDFVMEAVAFFNKNKLDQAFAAFNHDKKFKRGELYIFAYDLQGNCMAHGQDTEFIWQNLYNLKDIYGVPFIQQFIEKAQQGGGWSTYQWRGSTKLSFTYLAKKDGKSYVIGCGYYPQSKVDVVVNLVKGAVSLFNDIIKSGRSIDEAFSTFNYPLGRFVFGELYLYALDFNGIQVAHGELPGIVGTNAWMYRDAQGKLVNQEIIAKLKTVPVGQGIWIDYISKNAPKRTYAEKVADAAGKNYFIACGYYPDADSKQAVNLVERGYQYMKYNGKNQAIRAFTEDTEFKYGDLYLFIYDMKGNKLVPKVSSGDQINMFDAKDEDGSYYIREFIQKAQKQEYGWVDYREKNAFKTAYIEKIDIGESYVIGCALQPVNKRETMLMLAKSGSDYFKGQPLEQSMREFVKVDGKYLRGDLSMFVLDAQGICLAAGDNKVIIWRNLMNDKDDTGKEYIKLLINTVKKNRGPATISYRLNGATFIQHSIPITKDGKDYLVGSGFYL